MEYRLYFTHRPDDFGEVIALMEELGGMYIGTIPGGHRFVFSNRFGITYRHESTAIGCMAEADLTKNHTYDDDRFIKQLQRILRRLPGFAFCPASGEAIQMERGRADYDFWGGHPSLQAVIGGVTYQVHKVDDSGMATLWGRRPEGNRGVPVGRVPPDLTEPELAIILIQHRALA